MPTSVILKAVSGAQAGREFLCGDRSQVIIGRSRSSHIQLPEDPTVSRHHCLVEIQGHRVRVSDLGSKNGTYVNGDLVGQRPAQPDDDVTLREQPDHSLRSGDELRVGASTFLVEVLARADSPRGGLCLAYA